MADRSKIEWTDATWNPVTGCTQISAGCAHCYAARMAKRLQAMGKAQYRDGFEVRCHPEQLDVPLHWKKPRRIFTCSMSDLFHPAVPDRFVHRVLEVMVACPQHAFQVLTKRAYRIENAVRAVAEERGYRDQDGGSYLANLWLGVTVENAHALERVAHLRVVPAALRFLSCEPLLGPLDDLDLEGLGWVIVGGETGPGARPMRAEWVLEIHSKCRDAGVPFFFKRWGGNRRGPGDHLIEGKSYEQTPDIWKR